jgi:GNAT superfamily N-acetyltransferase
MVKAICSRSALGVVVEMPTQPSRWRPRRRRTLTVGTIAREVRVEGMRSVMPEVEVVRVDERLEDEFFSVHSVANECGWCYCVAWWVPDWEGFGDRTATQNRTLREDLFRRGEHDGYLARVGGRPVGWCQVGLRDRLVKLVRQMGLDPSPGTYAITCFQVVPRHRRSGVASSLLAGVLEDLRSRGARRVEAYPRRGEHLAPGELWTGPLEMYERQGFSPVGGDPRSPVLALDLGAVL